MRHRRHTVASVLARRLGPAAAIGVIGALALVAPASAHEAPDGAEWVMADWMLMSWFLFFSAALLVFVVALRRGLLRNLEAGKHHILRIEEEDYYTPDWAREEPANDDQIGGLDAQRS